MDNNYYGQDYSGRNMKPGGKNKKVLIAVCIAILLSVLAMLIAVYALISADVISIGVNSDKEKVESSETKTDEKAEKVEASNPEEADSNETSVAETPEEETAPQPAPTPQPVTMHVANVPNSIYLRSVPQEVDGNQITTIPVGSKVLFLENTDAIFAKVSYGDTTGYVKREYLSTSMPKKNSSQNSGNTTVVKYMYVANVPNSIYLRSAPQETNGNQITTIPVGEQVGYIEYTNSVFSKVKYNGTIGYVKTKYLEDYYQAPSAGYMTVTGVPNSIYLRSSAVENSGNILCTIPVGSTVQFVSYGNGTFYEIAWGGYIGYAKSKYLSWN